MMTPARAWWKEAVVYQVYLRSFKDSDGDGIGDLGGLTQKLGYLEELGVDVLWLSPIFASPDVDNGYDVSDYRAIQPAFGTQAGFERLLRELKARKLRVILDLVANHSSDRHPWFLESRTARDSPRRDYYIWRPARNGGPPNNWRSCFGGPAWQLDPATGEYYLHLFAKQQPDLNWESPRVRAEIHEVMRFWLDKGIDGFRLDAIPFISKDPGFPDYPPDFDGDLGRAYAQGPRLHEYLQELNREVLSRYDVMTVGEGSGVAAHEAPQFVDERRRELNMIYHFDLLTLDRVGGDFLRRRPGGFQLGDFKAVFTRWDRALGDTGWSGVLLGNHDFPRMLSRFGDDAEFRVPASKLLGTLLLTMKGTPFLYQGDELGMANGVVSRSEDCDDVATRSAHAELLRQGRDPAEFLADLCATSRDHARTPFPWDGSRAAGFSSGRPWLAVNPDCERVNAQSQQADAGSPLAFFKLAIRVRKRNPVLVYGSFQDLDPSHPDVFAYRRTLAGESVVVVLNFRGRPQGYVLPSVSRLGAVLLSNYPADAASGPELRLRPFEAVVRRAD